MHSAASFHIQSALAALVGGLVLLYISALSLAGSMVGLEEVTPGRRAVSHAIPIAITAIITAVMGYPTMALGILTASAVAAISLAPGIAILMSPSHAPAPHWAMRWRTFLPAALLLWLIGFSAQINIEGACFLLIEGLALLLIWRQPFETPGTSATRPAISIGGFILVLLGIGLAIVGAPLVVFGTKQQQFNVPLAMGIVAAGILAPILILPVLSESARLAERGRAAEARTAQVGLGLINICLLVPIIGFIGYANPHAVGAVATTLPSVQSAAVTHVAAPFPLGIWRIDCVLLIVLGLWFVISTFAEWSTSKIEGIILILVYGAYLATIVRIRNF